MEVSRPAVVRVPLLQGSAVTLRPPASVTAGDAIHAGRKLVDKVKSRAALTGYCGTAAGFFNLARNPVETWDGITSIATTLLHGQVTGVGVHVGALVHLANHPSGLGRLAFNGALGLQSISSSTVGSLELYQGFKNRDWFLAKMGMADMVGAAAAATLAAGAPTAALTMSVVSSAAMVALVATNPREYSRIQKVATICDATVTTGFVCMMSGFAVLPAVAATTLTSLAGTLYMNVPSIRRRADKLIDGVLARFRPHPKPVTGGA